MRTTSRSALGTEQVGDGNAQCFGKLFHRVYRYIGWIFSFEGLKMLVVQTSPLRQFLLRKAASFAELLETLCKKTTSFFSHVACILAERSSDGHPTIARCRIGDALDRRADNDLGFSCFGDRCKSLSDCMDSSAFCSPISWPQRRSYPMATVCSLQFPPCSASRAKPSDDSSPHLWGYCGSAHSISPRCWRASFGW